MRIDTGKRRRVYAMVKHSGRLIEQGATASPYGATVDYYVLDGKAYVVHESNQEAHLFGRAGGDYFAFMAYRRELADARRTIEAAEHAY